MANPGDEVFIAQPVTGDRDEFVHVVAKRPTRVFPYTIRLWHTCTDSKGMVRTKECAPLDPVIVNRD